jgi:excisionase family DNA binding protein
MTMIAIDEVAKRLGIGVPAVRRLLRDGAMVGKMYNGFAVIEESEVDRYLREHATDDRGTVTIREG